MTRSIRRLKPCSQSGEAARMRAAPQSPFSIASWCGLLHASRLICPLLEPSYFHARLLPPKVSHHDYSAPSDFAEVPFRNENGQNRQNLLLFLTRRPLPPIGSHVRHISKEGGRIYEPSEENAGKHYETDFAPESHAWIAALCRHRRCGSVTPARLQRRDWSLLYGSFYILIYLLETNVCLECLLPFRQ